MQNLSIILQSLAWLLLILVDPLQSDRQGIVLVPRDVFVTANHQISRINPAPFTPTVYYEQQQPFVPLISEAQARGQYYNYGPVVTPNPWIQPYSQNPRRLNPKQVDRTNTFSRSNYPTIPRVQEPRNQFEETDERFQAFEVQNLNNAKDIELQRKLKDLDEILSEKSDHAFDVNNRIEGKGFSDADIPEETKRVVRQIRKQKPGFFWTLAKLAFETYNDTRSAYQQIGKIINDGLAPETTTRKPAKSSSLMNMKTSTAATTLGNQSNITVTTAKPQTTTPYRLTRTELQGIIRRNVKGLVRLFNIEWREALNQSDITVKEFQRDLGKQVGIYLKDNPDVY